MSSNYPPGVTGCEPEIVAPTESELCQECGADLNVKERQAGADEVATAILPDLHKVAGLIAVAPGLAHSALLELIADLANPLEVTNKRALQVRTEAAKEHARMVREVSTAITEKDSLDDIHSRLYYLAQAIEKGAK